MFFLVNIFKAIQMLNNLHTTQKQIKKLSFEAIVFIFRHFMIDFRDKNTISALPMPK